MLVVENHNCVLSWQLIVAGVVGFRVIHLCLTQSCCKHLTVTKLEDKTTLDTVEDLSCVRIVSGWEDDLIRICWSIYIAHCFLCDILRKDWRRFECNANAVLVVHDLACYLPVSVIQLDFN